jgi:uncharacterized protein (TIGR02001 family)
MKTLTRLAAGIALTTGAMAVSSSALADFSYNVGYASDYYYRGVPQASSVASAGVDYEGGGLSLGAWTANLGQDQGVEIDLYGSYGWTLTEDVDVYIGYTYYYYTGEFSENAEEVNAGIRLGMLTFDYALGDVHDSDQTYGDDLTYNWLAATINPFEGWYLEFGTYGDELDGDYAQLTYEFNVSDIDMGISFLMNNKDINGFNQYTAEAQAIKSDDTIIFTIGKTW